MHKKLKSLLLSAICLGIASSFGYLGWLSIEQSYELSAHGVTTIGTVIKPPRNVTIEYYFNINYIAYGDTERPFDLRENYPLGSEVYVTYSNRNPQIARVTKEKSLWKLVKQDGWIIWFVLGVFLVFGYFGIANLKNVFFTSAHNNGT